MAQLEMTVDTETGQVAVRVNGDEVADVRGVEVQCYGEEKRAYASFTVSTWQGDGDVSRRVCITASDRGAVVRTTPHDRAISEAFAQLVGRGAR